MNKFESAPWLSSQGADEVSEHPPVRFLKASEDNGEPKNAWQILDTGSMLTSLSALCLLSLGENHEDYHVNVH